MSGIVTASYLVEWKPAGSWVDVTSYVLSVEGGTALTSSGDNPLSFGDSAEAKCTIDVLDTLSGAWERTPIRVTFTISATSTQTFVGLVVERQRSDDGSMSFDCTGASAFPQATKAYSGLFTLRPLATKTTLTSVDDPTSGSYAAGAMNYIMWQAGGRPYEQNATYTSASFYYSFDQAVLAPTYSWVAGEDGWAEAQKMAQAAGGQLYQDLNGVVIYRQPFNIVNASATYTFDESVYESIEERTPTGQLATKVVCSFTPRAARPLQQITDETTPRLIHIGESITVTVEPQWPLKSIETASGLTSLATATTITNLLTSAIVITDGSGKTTPQGASGYTHSLAASAQRLALTITNTAGKPLTLWRITYRGEPITAGEAGNVSVGSGTVERQLSDNPYIQTKGDATRLANLVSLFYGTSRAQRTLRGCPFDPNRSVGEIVNVTSSRLSISGAHVIVSLDHSDTGATAEYTVAPIADLPTAASFFLVGSTSYTGLTKKLGY